MRQPHLTPQLAPDLLDDNDPKPDTSREVAAAIAAVAEIMYGMESGRLPATPETVARLQRATAELEALVAQLP